MILKVHQSNNNNNSREKGMTDWHSSSGQGQKSHICYLEKSFSAIDWVNLEFFSLQKFPEHLDMSHSTPVNAIVKLGEKEKKLVNESPSCTLNAHSVISALKLTYCAKETLLKATYKSCRKLSNIFPGKICTHCVESNKNSAAMFSRSVLN